MSRQAPQLVLAGSVLKVAGDIDPNNVVTIRREGERLIAACEEPAMTIDLSEMGVAHSAALSLLMCWLRAARRRTISLRVEGAGGRLQSLAALSGLEHQLPGLAAQVSRRSVQS